MSNPVSQAEGTKYQGWWRCRLKGRTRTYPWYYFTTSAPNKRDFRRNAKAIAAFLLKRVDFDFEQAVEPQGLHAVASDGGHTLFVEKPVFTMPEAAR